MANPINSTEAARLIEAGTGRRCSRQNMDKLCERGALQGSPCILQTKPLRVDGDLLVSEYLAKVAPHQAEAVQPRAKRPALARLAPNPQPSTPPPPSDSPPADDGEVPNFNDERARHEREKRLIAEMERRQKAGELVYRADYDQAQKAVALYLSGQIEALPRQIRQQLPHLSAADEEVVEQLVRRLLDQVADWRMDRDEVAA